MNEFRNQDFKEIPNPSVFVLFQTVCSARIGRGDYSLMRDCLRIAAGDNLKFSACVFVDILNELILLFNVNSIAIS